MWPGIGAETIESWASAPAAQQRSPTDGSKVLKKQALTIKKFLYKNKNKSFWQRGSDLLTLFLKGFASAGTSYLAFPFQRLWHHIKIKTMYLRREETDLQMIGGHWEVRGL